MVETLNENKSPNAAMVERSIVDNCLAYVNRGFNLLEELVRHRFTNDKRLAELLIIRAEQWCNLTLARLPACPGQVNIVTGN